VATGRKPKTIVSAVPERAARIRQRQRLIDACISALHLHGPSRTTVEKVVALADLSPGIVRFYFDSKDAMLVASLAYLAAEFEERVMVPVARMKETPVEALRRLVELYLDPDIASPRKVSVWYSFWGEASSRQEYYDICGRKDEDFAALVRDLVGRVVALAGEPHLNTEGIALGLIGVLEVLWQGIAFQNEADIDRGADRAQCIAFLRSVFPRQFGPQAELAGSERAGSGPASADDRGHLPPSAYADATLLTAERERLFRPTWQVIGHEVELASPGNFLSGDLAVERALVVRDAKGVLRAFRNACRRRPHALVDTRTGHFADAIVCVPHGLRYGFDGTLLEGGAEGDLAPLELKLKSGLILVRSPGAAREGGPALTGWDAFAELAPLRVTESEVAADWKLLVEQWLEGPSPRGRFLAPNQLIEVWSGGAIILRALPVGPGRSRLQRLEFGAADADKRAIARARNSKDRARDADLERRRDTWIEQHVELAASIQAGLSNAGQDVAESGPVSAALAQFRSSIAALRPHPGPT
jgi:TetR/AcrR family transcriptional repressor of bet genes